ncbi:MAG: hypothetical protein AAFZ07_00945 [Actinomycetota bacterium]
MSAASCRRAMLLCCGVLVAACGGSSSDGSSLLSGEPPRPDIREDPAVIAALDEWRRCIGSLGVLGRYEDPDELVSALDEATAGDARPEPTDVVESDTEDVLVGPSTTEAVDSASLLADAVETCNPPVQEVVSERLAELDG